jgi:two-component system chemotaxis response regulator CheB
MLGRITETDPLPPPAVVALAASAGGVEALSIVVAGLPADLPAAVFVVLHVAPIGPSVLPAIIGRYAHLKAHHATDGEAVVAGEVYVAPPDYHLLVEDGLVRVLQGPRENGNRPAADPLFRSVAASYGKRAAGVVLSGSLDDGTAGLASIKDAGGLTVVQDPEEAAFPGMPMNAIANVEPDCIASLYDIPGILARFAEEVSATGREHPNEIAAVTHDDELVDPPSEFTCPDCGGTLWFVGEQPLQLRCRVGHSFSTESFDVGKKDAIENALWAGIVALEERADLSRRLLRRLPPTSGGLSAKRHRKAIEQSERGADTLRQLAAELIGPLTPFEQHPEGTEGDGED